MVLVCQFYLVAVLYPLAESLRIIAIWISRVLPRGTHGIFDQDGFERKGRTVLTRGCGVREIAGWARGRQTSAAVPAG